MNTQQLESFIQVAENLNFARAAEILNITQSAVSRQIHSLEDELGTKLFNRSTRTVTLTPEGNVFLDDAKSIIAKLRTATAKIQHRSGVNVPLISIGCKNEADLDLLCKILKECRKEIPELHPFLRIIPYRYILSMFYDEEIDLLFGFKDEIPIRGDTIYKELVKIPLCCLIPSSHSFACKEEISETEMYNEKIITCSSYTIPTKAAEIQNRISQHILPDQIHFCENMQVILTLVRAGYGISVLPKLNFVDPEIKYVPLKNIEPLSYGFFYKKGASNVLQKKVMSIIKKLDNI